MLIYNPKMPSHSDKTLKSQHAPDRLCRYDRGVSPTELKCLVDGETKAKFEGHSKKDDIGT